MNKGKIQIFGLLGLSALVMGGCVPTPVPPAATCPPLGSAATEVVGGSDGSSIAVYSGTYGETDATPSDPWCSISQLNITLANLTGLPACPFSGCLVAVDVKPDNIGFPSSLNTSSTRPTLSFDLSEHPPSEDLNLEACSATYSCFGYYRYNGASWVFAGAATAIPVGTEWFATGRIDHFSIYALVVLPNPAPVPPPRQFVLVIQSEFHLDDNGGMSVAVLIAEDDRQEYTTDSGEKILTFIGIDALIPAGDVPAGCNLDQSVEALFTCMFPPGTRVQLERGENFTALTALETGLRMEFAVLDVFVQ